jgi:hypothetical protein
MLEQILYDLILPPVATFIWWLMSRGWASAMGINNSEAVRSWSKPGF